MVRSLSNTSISTWLERKRFYLWSGAPKVRVDRLSVFAARAYQARLKSHALRGRPRHDQLYRAANFARGQRKLPVELGGAAAIADAAC